MWLERHDRYDTFAAEALDRATRAWARNPAVDAARACATRGDLRGAAAALAPLGEGPLAILTLALSRYACARGLGERAQAPLFDQLDRRLPAGTEAGRIDRAVAENFLLAWAREADGVLSSAAIARVLGRGVRGVVHLQSFAAERARAGRLADARVYAAAIGGYHKRFKATALAHVGLAELRAGDPTGAERLDAAVTAAVAPPMIQDGGEEADALGQVVRVMAEGGLAVDHPAVARAVAELRALAEVRGARDVRSLGVAVAVEGCAARADDPGWRALGEDLLARIWDRGNGDRARRALFAASGAPIEPPPRTSVVDRWEDALVGGDLALAESIAAEAPGKVQEASQSAALRLVDAGREDEAVALTARSGVFWPVADRVQRLDSIDGLLAVWTTLRPWDKGLAAERLAMGAARLQVGPERIAALCDAFDGLTDASSRMLALCALAAGPFGELTLDLAARAALPPSGERLHDPVAVAVAWAEAARGRGLAPAASTERLWQHRAPATGAWLAAVEANGDLALVRRVVDQATAGDLLSRFPASVGEIPPLAPYGRMLCRLPDDEADAAEQASIAACRRSVSEYFADAKISAVLAGRASDPQTAARRLPVWLATLPEHAGERLAALAPALAVDLDRHLALLARDDDRNGHPAHAALASALARAGRSEAAIALTEAITDRRAPALWAIAAVDPTVVPTARALALGAHPGPSEWTRLRWYEANVRLALADGDLDEALDVLDRQIAAKFIEGSAVWIGDAIAASEAPERWLDRWLWAVRGSLHQERGRIVASALPAILARCASTDAAAARAELAVLTDGMRQDDAAVLDVASACGELRAGRGDLDAVTRAIHRCEGGSLLKRAYGPLADAIAGTPGAEPVYPALFGLTRRWSAADAGHALATAAEVVRPDRFVAAVRGAGLPVASVRSGLSRAMPWLAADPEALREVIGQHPDDLPLVRAALAWLEVARVRAGSVPPS